MFVNITITMTVDKITTVLGKYLFLLPVGSNSLYQIQTR